MSHLLTIKLAAEIIEQAVKIGVREFCICPGARNYQLANFLMNDNRIVFHSHTDERSAAFYALGKIKKERRPVAVITTSGTAAGELLPATMEAYYTSLPLLLITADRPKRYRKSGAPQAAEQVNIFGIYAPFQLDLEENGFNLEEWSQNFPAHLNVCFEEPLESEQPPLNLPKWEIKAKEATFSYDGWHIDSNKVFLDREAHERLNEFLDRANHLFVVVSSLKPKDREQVVHSLLHLGAPVFLEGQSGLREDERLAKLRIHRTEKLWTHAQKGDYEIDSILRIGGVPTFRFWRDIEEKNGDVELFSINDAPFTGISWGTMAFANISTFLQNHFPSKKFETKKGFKWLSLENRYLTELKKLIDQLPQSQCGMVHKLSTLIPKSSNLFLGNSLSIRDWDLAATFENRNIQCFASRGLNGIDGQISTFLGILDERVENWALLGDLTTIYDMNGLWILHYLENYNYRIRLAVVNNHGGKIFTGKFSDPRFQNPHQIHFEHLAKFWGLDYQRWDSIPDSFSTKSSKILIEICPQAIQSREFTQRLMHL